MGVVSSFFGFLIKDSVMLMPQDTFFILLMQHHRTIENPKKNAWFDSAHHKDDAEILKRDFRREVVWLKVMHM